MGKKRGTVLRVFLGGEGMQGDGRKQRNPRLRQNSQHVVQDLHTHVKSSSELHLVCTEMLCQRKV